MKPTEQTDPTKPAEKTPVKLSASDNAMRAAAGLDIAHPGIVPLPSPTHDENSAAYREVMLNPSNGGKSIDEVAGEFAQNRIVRDPSAEIPCGKIRSAAEAEVAAQKVLDEAARARREAFSAVASWNVDMAKHPQNVIRMDSLKSLPELLTQMKAVRLANIDDLDAFDGIFPVQKLIEECRTIRAIELALELLPAKLEKAQAEFTAEVARLRRVGRELGIAKELWSDL